MSAVGCALIQQWCYEYLKFANPRAAPHESGRVRTYLFQGLNQFQMRQFMSGTHALLHISVILFFWAITDFFHTVHHYFGTVTRFAFVAAMVFYTVLSIAPLISSNSPYNTPLTHPLRIAINVFRVVIRFPSRSRQWRRDKSFKQNMRQYCEGIYIRRHYIFAFEAEKQAAELERYAMKWLFTKNNFSDKDMDKFLQGLPGYISSSLTKKDQLDEYLTSDYILRRIKEHFMTCATSTDLSDEDRIDRVSSCITSLRLIFQYSLKRKSESPVPDKRDKELQLQRRYIQELTDRFQTLCGMDDQEMALRASCIRGLAIQGILSQVLPDGSTIERPRSLLPLVPIYKLLFPNVNEDTIRQLEGGHTPNPVGVKSLSESLRYDGPLANLTTLAQAVRDKEHAPSTTLTLCWKALDILLTRLGAIHFEEFTPAQSEFDNLHKNIHEYVHFGERGFRIKPLLERLDAAARGRRLLLVFSGHPKYHSSADIVFEKEYLQNSDLLEAFAHCLTEFIAKHPPDICRDFMEKVIVRDDLWTNLQVNLWNTQRSDSPHLDKLRVFEDCCTVLDLAFSVLEDSHEVDWRAPEFGSLSQHFDSFIAYYFQGSLMSRATRFRVDFIKARFCKALLSQFWGEIDRKGTVSFLSQWDVEPLARLVYSLGLSDKEDAEFWDSYVNGGHIGPEFTARTFEMIDITARDGPLLIFSQLGHLVTTAVPLHHSGLEPEDMEKVLDLQTKVIEKERPPLNRASDSVWEALNRLREQVGDLCGKNTGKDKEILQRLLGRIEDVLKLRFSSSEHPSQSELVKEKGPKTPVAASSMSSSGESRGISDRSGIASKSTAVTGGPSRGTQTSGGGDGFGRASSLLFPRVFIDLQPERSADKDLERERKTNGRSESLQGYHSHFRGLSSPSPTLVDRPIGASPVGSSSVIPFSQYVADVRQRRIYSSMGRIGTAFGAASRTRTSTSELFALRRDALAFPIPATSSPHGSSDFSDEGR